MVNKIERFSIERSVSILQKRLAEESDPIKKAKLQKRIAKHESNDRIYQKAVSELRVAPNDETLKVRVAVCGSILFVNENLKILHPNQYGQSLVDYPPWGKSLIRFVRC